MKKSTIYHVVSILPMFLTLGGVYFLIDYLGRLGWLIVNSLLVGLACTFSYLAGFEEMRECSLSSVEKVRKEYRL